MDLASKIRVARLLAGYGQRELAREMGMKSATHINRWEQGISAPRSNMLQKLGYALQIYWPWLLDSSLPYVQSDGIFYRPLSPYIDYTDQWLSIMPKHLAELLPDFLSELQYNNIVTFSAPCGGGVIVGNAKTPLMITCRQELFPILLETIPAAEKHNITDTEFAEHFFKGVMTQELFKRSGISAPYIEPFKEPPPKVTVYVKLTASIYNTVDIAGIQIRLDKKMQKLINESGLEEVELDVSVTASKSTNQFVSEFVVGKEMKELAQLLLVNESNEQ